MRDLLERLLRLVRYPLWVALASAAALCVVTPFTDGPGQLSAVLGVLLGGVLGELVGRSRLRGVWILLASALGLLGLRLVDWLLVGWWPVASLVGPVTALHFSNVVSLGGLGLVGGATLRALGRRSSLGRALELGAAASAVAFAFAAHRDGSIARPLWLSDRAWEAGLDPVNLILFVGVLLGISLPTLMLLESRRRLPLLAPLVLPVLVLLVFLFTDPATLQTPPQVSALDDIQDGFASAPEAGDGDNNGGGGGAQGEQDSQDGGRGKAGKAKAKAGDGPPVQGQQDGDTGEGQYSESGDSGQSDQGEQEDPGDVQANLDGGGGGGEPTPVAILLLGDDYTPPNESFYLRQEPHSQFNGTRLVKATGAMRDLDFLDHFAVSRTQLQQPPVGHRARIQGTVSLLVEHTAPFALEAPVEYAPTRNPHPGRFVRTYSFVSRAQNTPYEQLIGFAAGSPTWGQEEWDHYTEGPDDPRYQALAEQLVGELPEHLRDDPFARALKVKLYLDENMKYTRSERHEGVDDPTADFLFGNLTGYCVHSAHASVFLWRSLGLPARIGTGYLVQAEQQRGSTLMIRDDQAHAWPELYLDDLGWVVLDVAPAENLDPVAEPIDEELLQALADLARDQEPEDDREPIDYAALWAAALRLARGLLAVLAVAVLGTHYTVKLWRRLRPRLAGQGLPRVGYRSTLDRLAEAGIRREVGETREQFARRVGGRMPAFEALTRIHLRAALGRPGQPVDAAEWWDRSAAFRQQLRAHTRWWRRVLGLLNPFSFYRAR